MSTPLTEVGGEVYLLAVAAIPVLPRIEDMGGKYLSLGC
jgi:hypothetical protein